MKTQLTFASLVVVAVALSACSSNPPMYKTEYTRHVVVESNEPCAQSHTCPTTGLDGAQAAATVASEQAKELEHLKERLEDERLARMNDRITDTRGGERVHVYNEGCNCDVTRGRQ